VVGECFVFFLDCDTSFTHDHTSRNPSVRPTALCCEVRDAGNQRVYHGEFYNVFGNGAFAYRCHQPILVEENVSPGLNPTLDAVVMLRFVFVVALWLQCFVDESGVLYLMTSQLDRPSDALHPYGYAGGLHVSVLCATMTAFMVGTGFTVWSMAMAFSGHHHPQNLTSSAALLVACAAIESVTLFYAWRQCRAEAAKLEVSPAAYVFDPMADPRTLFILAEDASALLSCAVGAICILLSEATGSAVWDSVGTACIAAILGMQFAFVWRRTIVAVSNPTATVQLVQRVKELIESDHMVR
jgi:divalent metal cation (Fe/Co/Zn/Cd) transporter